MKIPGLTPGHKYYLLSVVLFPKASRGLRCLNDGDGGGGVTLSAIITVHTREAVSECHDTSFVFHFRISIFSPDYKTFDITSSCSEVSLGKITIEPRVLI